MEESKKTPYDEVSYPSFPISYTHPDRLATVASLLGMKPAPVDECRVLEIGCFDGVNLAAMAMTLPRCEFVGVDAAGTAIARGRAMAEQVGLKNLALRHLDLMEMAPIMAGLITSLSTACTHGFRSPCAYRSWPSATEALRRRVSLTLAITPFPVVELA